MGYFILEAALFVPGFLAFVYGKIPMTRRRSVNGAAARVVGAILMVPLPLYLFACRSCHVSPLASDEEIQAIMDPLKPFTAGFLRLGAVAAAFFCALLATVLAVVTSETKRR
jgi:hypothetical protein